MVLFVHIILANSDDGLAMTLGETYAIGDDGPECLSRAPRNLAPGGGGGPRIEPCTRSRSQRRTSRRR